MLRRVTIRGWLRANRHVHSRFADLYDDMRGDPCLPRHLTLEVLLAHIEQHDGCDDAIATAREAWAMFEVDERAAGRCVR